MADDVQVNSLRHMSNSVNAWDAAIADAQALIEQEKGKVRALRQAIKKFERLRNRGVAFPVGPPDRVLGQDSDL